MPIQLFHIGDNASNINITTNKSSGIVFNTFNFAYEFSGMRVVTMHAYSRMEVIFAKYCIYFSVRRGFFQLHLTKKSTDVLLL